LWWNANTISHNFLHLPFFRADRANRFYSLYLSVLLGFPQSLWRALHLAHHESRSNIRWFEPVVILESALVLVLWAVLLTLNTGFLLTIYLPGFTLGMALCYLHGQLEHRPATSSHYGMLYNIPFFNDGYHVEHHDRPQCHWTRLPAHRGDMRVSRYPAVLRWLDLLSLAGLERMVLRSGNLQHWVLERHEQATRKLLRLAGPIESVTIVGGGLFPRSIRIFRRLLPGVRITVIDANLDHIATARRFLTAAGIDGNVNFMHAQFDVGSFDTSADLWVAPLSLIGDRKRLCQHPPARLTLIHDWLWNRGPDKSAIVSLLLLKRINLVRSRA
jgi:hypothetical protein